MSSDGKKISFGFSKISKKPNVLAPTLQEKKSVELIDCLEGSQIKVKNAKEIIVEAPSVIPVEENVGPLERRTLKNNKVKTEPTDEDARPDCELTIEELAARQLLKESRNKLMQSKDTVKVHTVPIEESSTVENGIESSSGDYESVPIEDFGLACIRGMGWKEGIAVGKKQTESIKLIVPDQRPKVLGLGAQNILNLHKDVYDKDDKKLFLTKGAYAKIIAGPHMSKFCEVQFTDEWSRMVTVKMHATNEVVTLSELLVIPITKETYERESKVINNAKYEQFKSKDKYIEVAPNNKSSEKKSKARFASEELHTEHVKVENVSPENEIYLEAKSNSSLKHKTARDEKEYKNKRSRSRERSTRKKPSGRFSDSSDGSEHERNEMKSSRKHSRRKDEVVSSGESSEEHTRKRRKNRSRSRSRSSSTEYYKNFSSKKKNERRSLRKKSKKNDRKNRDSSGGRSRSRSSCSDSDEEYKHKKSSRNEKNDRYSSNRKKSRKQKNRRKDRDSSESDFSEKKSGDYRNKSKTEKYKSRY